MLRAEVLRGEVGPRRSAAPPEPSPSPAAPPFPTSRACAVTPVYLRDVFDKWVEAKPRSADT